MSLVAAIDTLDEARCLFDAAQMAICGLDDGALDEQDKQKALATVLFIGMRRMEAGLAMLDHERAERKGRAS